MNSPSVLIVVDSDGYVKAYADPTVSVMIINRPYASNPEDGVRADELLDEILPSRYADVFFPGWLKAALKPEKMTAERIGRKIQTIDALALLDDKPRFSNFKSKMLAVLGANGRYGKPQTPTVSNIGTVQTTPQLKKQRGKRKQPFSDQAHCMKVAAQMEKGA